MKRSTSINQQVPSKLGSGALKPRTESHPLTSAKQWLSGTGVENSYALLT